MLEFLKLNAGTILVGAIVLLIVISAFLKMKSDKKKGGCCGGCAGCPSQGACGMVKEQQQNKD